MCGHIDCWWGCSRKVSWLRLMITPGCQRCRSLAHSRPMMGGRGHVFISYARTDGLGCADRLYRTLSDRGIAAWRDQRDLDPYQDFSSEIEIALESARHVVVCLTPSIAERR